MMLRNCFSVLALLASFLCETANADVFISEAYFRPLSGNQPSAFVELFNNGNDISAANYQLCYGDDGECVQLSAGLWRKDTYYVLCSDMTSHPQCRQGLNFILSGVTSLEIKDINWNSKDSIDLEDEVPIPGAAYERTNSSSTTLVPMSIQSPGKGYLGGDAAPMPIYPEDTEGFEKEFQLIINEYNLEEGWVEIGYWINDDDDIGNYAITVYDPVTGKKKWASKLTNADFTVGQTMNGMYFATKYNIPQYGEQYSGVTLSGNGVVWDAISYDSSFVAQDGPGQGAIATGLQYLHGMRTGEGCNATILPWVAASTNSAGDFNPGELVTCNGQRSELAEGVDPDDGNVLIEGWSNHPSMTPSVSAAPSDSPTVDKCAQNACGPNSGCVNADNSLGYICSCNSGYELSGTSSCVDIDECTTIANLCPTTATCTNTPGNYTCTCLEGFRGKNCIDITECKWRRERRVCSREDSAPNSGVVGGNRGRENCEELEPGYRCVCKPGLYRDETTNQCLDIDECTNPNVCGSGKNCINTYRNFTCVDITGSPTSDPTATPTTASPSSNAPSLSFVPSNSFMPTNTTAPSVTQFPSFAPSITQEPSLTLFPSSNPSVTQEPSLTSLPTLAPSDAPSG